MGLLSPRKNDHSQVHGEQELRDPEVANAVSSLAEQLAHSFFSQSPPKSQAQYERKEAVEKAHARKYGVNPLERMGVSRIPFESGTDKKSDKRQ
jgi:hypothetical protein